MEKNTNINMSNESSAHNDINNITLKKKTLNGVEVIDEPNNNYNNNNDNNTSNNSYQFGNNNANNNVIGKEQFIQNNPNYHSGIIYRKELKPNRKPSVLIIFIIIVVIFFGELIYNVIANKKPSDEINSNQKTTEVTNDTEEQEITPNDEVIVDDSEIGDIIEEEITDDYE